jgi:hypothetical protein
LRLQQLHRGPGTDDRQPPGGPPGRWPGWPPGWCRSPRQEPRSGPMTRRCRVSIRGPRAHATSAFGGSVQAGGPAGAGPPWPGSLRGARVMPPVRPARRIGSDVTRPPTLGIAPRDGCIGAVHGQPKPVGRFATVGDCSRRWVLTPVHVMLGPALQRLERDVRSWLVPSRGSSGCLHRSPPGRGQGIGFGHGHHPHAGRLGRDGTVERVFERQAGGGVDTQLVGRGQVGTGVWLA